MAMGPGWNISKLLGTPSGFHPTVQDVDSFLLNRVKKKSNFGLKQGYRQPVESLQLTMSFHLHIVLSYYVGGSKDVLSKLRTFLQNYLWFGLQSTTPTQVRWDTTVQHNNGGLSITNRESASLPFVQMVR